MPVLDPERQAGISRVPGLGRVFQRGGRVPRAFWELRAPEGEEQPCREGTQSRVQGSSA